MKVFFLFTHGLRFVYTFKVYYTFSNIFMYPLVSPYGHIILILLHLTSFDNIIYFTPILKKPSQQIKERNKEKKKKNFQSQTDALSSFDPRKKKYPEQSH